MLRNETIKNKVGGKREEGEEDTRKQKVLDNKDIQIPANILVISNSIYYKNVSNSQIFIRPLKFNSQS